MADAQVGVKITTKESGANQAGRNVKSLQSHLKDLGTQALAVTGTIAAFGFAMKKGLDFAEQGRSLQQLDTTFANLSASIDTTSEALLGRLRDATKSMVADSDLMASANRFVSMGLASTADEAEKLANIAVTLGSAMGKGPTAAMEEFALMLANQSIPRLDTFGISAGRVRQRIEELQAATPGMTRETAFMTAVMEQAETSMEKVGEVAENSASIIKAELKNAFNELAKTVSTEVEPVLKEISDETLPALVLAAQEAGPAIAEALKFGFQAVAGAADAVTVVALEKQLRDLSGGWLSVGSGATASIREMARQSNTVVDLRKNVELLTIAVDLMGNGWEGTLPEFEAAIQAIYAANLRAAAMNDVFGETETVTKKTAAATGELGDKIAQMANFMSDGEAEARSYRTRLDEVAAIAAKAAERHQFLSSVTHKAFVSMQDDVTEFVDAQRDLAKAQGEYVNAYEDNSAEILRIQERLSIDLTDEQRNTLRDQLMELDEYSAEAINIWRTLQNDLTENQRRELISQLADLQNTHGEMRTVYTGDAEAAEEAQRRISASMDAIKRNYQQLVIDIVAAKLAEKFGEDSAAVDLMLITLQEQLGLIDTQTANLLRGIVTNEREIALVVDNMMANGRISQEEAAALNVIIEQSAQEAVTGMGEAETATRTATDAIIDMKDAAQELVDNGPYIPTIDIDTTAAMRAIAEVQAAINALGAGAVGGYRHPDAPSGGGGAGGVAPPPSGGGSSGGGTSGGGGRGGHQEFALGGYTGATGGLVHPFEYVMPPEAVSRIGLGNLEAMRRGDSGGSTGGLTLVLPNYTGDPSTMAQLVITRVGEVYGNRMK